MRDVKPEQILGKTIIEVLQTPWLIHDGDPRIATCSAHIRLDTGLYLLTPDTLVESDITDISALIPAEIFPSEPSCIGETILQIAVCDYLPSAVLLLSSMRLLHKDVMGDVVGLVLDPWKRKRGEFFTVWGNVDLVDAVAVNHPTETEPAKP